jgi:transposase
LRDRLAHQRDISGAYIEQVLVHALKSGGIVIIDDLGNHKGKTVRAAIRAAGARLFLPPSPTCNRFGDLHQAFSLAERANYFRGAGSASEGRNED